MAKEPPLEITIDLRAVTGRFDLSYKLEQIRKIMPDEAVD